MTPYYSVQIFKSTLISYNYLTSVEVTFVFSIVLFE